MGGKPRAPGIPHGGVVLAVMVAEVDDGGGGGKVADFPGRGPKLVHDDVDVKGAGDALGPTREQRGGGGEDK